MKIQIRTLNQHKYELEVDPSTTIENLKDIIEERYQHAKAHQVLIFSGKVLSNELTVESCNVKDSDFLVLMVKKPKGAAATPTITSTPTVTSAPVRSSAAEPETKSNSANTSSVQATPPVLSQTPLSTDSSLSASSSASASSSSANLYSQSASTLVTGNELQSVADNIAGMGFPKEQVLLALRASFGNPDRALEYLLNGLPEGMTAAPSPAPLGAPAPSRPTSSSVAATPTTPATAQSSAGSTGGIRLPANILPPGSTPLGNSPLSLSTGGVQLPANIIPPSLLGGQPAQPASAAGAGVGLGAGAGASAGSGVFDFLRNHPAFPQLRQIARTDPERLQDIITRLVEQTPQLLPLIAQHQDEFIELLRGGPGGGGGGGGASGGVQIQVTPQDQEAINHLIGLGFSRNKAMEAYFLFEKDENLAANYLLSYGHDEDEVDFVDDEGGEPDE